MRIRRRRIRDLKPPTGPKRVKVGFPEGTDSDVLDRAVYNHFGTQTIPERPFIANPMRDKRAYYRRQMKSAAQGLFRGETQLFTVMSKLGIQAQGDIQEEIRNLQNPANAPSTVAQKGSSNPLIDSGQMRQSVTYKVEDK